MTPPASMNDWTDATRDDVVARSANLLREFIKGFGPLTAEQLGDRLDIVLVILTHAIAEALGEPEAERRLLVLLALIRDQKRAKLRSVQ